MTITHRPETAQKYYGGLTIDRAEIMDGSRWHSRTPYWHGKPIITYLLNHGRGVRAIARLWHGNRETMHDLNGDIL